MVRQIVKTINHKFWKKSGKMSIVQNEIVGILMENNEILLMIAGDAIDGSVN